MSCRLNTFRVGSVETKGSPDVIYLRNHDLIWKGGDGYADFNRSLQNNSDHESVQDRSLAAYLGNSQNAGMNPEWPVPTVPVPPLLQPQTCLL